MGITSTCKGRLSNTYLICILKSAENYSQISQNLITIFSQNIQSFEKSFQIILWFLNTDNRVKKARLRLVFSTSLSVLRNQRKNTIEVQVKPRFSCPVYSTTHTENISFFLGGGLLALPQGQGHHNSVSQLLWARITNLTLSTFPVGGNRG